MSCLAIYDDRAPISDAGREFIGITRYSQLLFRRRTIQSRTLDLLRESGYDEIRIIVRDQDLDPLRRAAEAGLLPDQVIYVPSSVVSVDPERSRLFLAKSRFVRDDFTVGFSDPDEPPVLLVHDAAAAALIQQLARHDHAELASDHSEQHRRVPAPNAGLASLHRYEAMVEFISTNFDVRHFNSIAQDGYVVTKRSSDRDKMRREYRLFDLLPEAMRMYFLPPLSFSDDGEYASYQVERLCIPDLGIQWVHGVITPGDFRTFLERISAFLALRPTRESSIDAARELYIGKCERRLAQLEAHPRYPDIADTFRLGDTGSPDLRHLLERYRQLWERHARRRPAWRTALSHGDLCFSNILYGRQTRLLKLIDPRGADDEADAQIDEYYDVAKLSHSICGRYDYINHDLTELRFSRDLRLGIEFPAACEDQNGLCDTFVSAMQAAGYHPFQLRLAEASLFLSMLPLHIDVPKKVVAFALTAAGIISDLESERS